MAGDPGRFLMDLSIALHQYAMYPPGHSSLVPALERLARRAETLLQDRPRIAVGVARNQLIIEGIATDVAHPLLRGLAERLHRHHLAALDFSRGLTIDELETVIAAIAEDPDRGAGPLGTVPRAAGLHAWPHVGLHPLNIEGLDIVDAGEGVGSVGSRGVELWIGLAKAALERAGDVSAPGLLGEPGVVARAIDEHQGVEAYDQVIVGYLLQIAGELRTADGADTTMLRRRTAQLVGAMQPETLRRLLDMGGNAAQRRRFLSDAATGMAAAAIVDVVQAAAAAGRETISSGLLRMLTKLAAHAETGTDDARSLAESALRDQVQRLINGWELEDPHPDDYRISLNRLAQADDSHPDAAGGRGPFFDPLRIVQMSLELEEDTPGLSEAVDRLVADTKVPVLLELLAAAPSSSVAQRLRAQLLSQRTVKAVVEGNRPDFASLDALLPYLDGEALAPLFDLLTQSDDRQLRRAAFDRLRRAGATATPLALERLYSNELWYVARNLLALVAQLEHLPDDFDPTPWLMDNDGRVRREALRIAIRIGSLRDEALLAALADADSRVIAVALAAVLDLCPAPAVPTLLELAARETLEDDLRAGAIKALAGLGPDRRVLELLLRVALPETRLLRWATQPAKSLASLAAIGALAAVWSHDARAAAVLKRAAASRDPDVRRAAGSRP